MLIRSTSIYFVGQVLIYAMPVALIPILTNILSAADYGVIGTFSSIYQVLDMVVALSGTGAVIRAYANKDRLDFSNYLFNAMFVNFALFLFALFPIYILYLSEVIHLPISVMYILPIVALLASLKAYKYKLWNIQKQPIKFSMFGVGFVVVSLSVSIALVYTIYPDWQSRVFGILIAEGLFCLISLHYLKKEDGIHFRLNTKYIFDVLKYGAPLIPHSIGLVLLATSDKLLLNSLSGLYSVGIFAVAHSFSGVLMLVVMPLDLATNPYVLNVFSHRDRLGEKRYIVGFILYSLIVSMSGLVLYLIAPFLFSVFIGEDFHSAIEYVGVLIIGQIFYAMYRYVVRGIFFSKETHLVSISTLTSGILGFLLQYFLIGDYGIMGVAIGTSFGLLVSFLMAWYFSNKLYQMQWSRAFLFMKEIRFLFFGR